MRRVLRCAAETAAMAAHVCRGTCPLGCAMEPVPLAARGCPWLYIIFGYSKILDILSIDFVFDTESIPCMGDTSNMAKELKNEEIYSR